MSPEATEFGTAAFWSRFVKRHWGRRPGVFRRLLPGPPVSPESLFGVLRGCGERVRTQPPERRSLRFYGDGYNSQVYEDFRAALPTARDRGFEDFARRLSRQLGSSEWGFALNDIHVASPEVWALVRQLGHALFSRIGLSGGRVSAESFIGPYRSTPFGVHKDKFHVFTMPVVGEKTTLVWPYEQLAPGLGLSRRAEALGRTTALTPFRAEVPGPKPTVLRAAVGDVMYWPPGHWHIARGAGDFSATLVVAVGANSNAEEWVAKLGGESAERWVRPLGRGQVSTGRHVNTIVAAARASARRLTKREFAHAVRDELERRCSACNVEPPVEPLDPAPELTLGDFVATDARFPIRVVRRGQSLECFINGYALSVTPPQAMKRLVAVLNRGGVFSVEKLCAWGSAWLSAEGYEPDSAHVLEFLGTCVALRAARLHPTR